MKNFLKWLLIVIGSLAAIFVVVGYMLPSKWTVSREITIAASPETIYEQVANLRNWQAWSPWTKEMDPTQVYTYEGPAEGTGAKWLWTSEKMGKGSLTIVDSEVKKGVAYKLFIDMEGQESHINGYLKYSPATSGQHVVWFDEGDAGDNLAQRWLTLMIKIMLGKEMDAGLQKLKQVAESKKAE
jgi:hypothetical protein